MRHAMVPSHSPFSSRKQRHSPLVLLALATCLVLSASLASATVLETIEQPTAASFGSADVFRQSFTPTVSGVITEVAVYTGSGGGSGSVNILDGDGVGPVIGSQGVVWAGGAFETVALSTPIPVTAGQVYTLEPLGTEIRALGDSPADPYSGGELWYFNDVTGPGWYTWNDCAAAGDCLAANYDMTFRVVIESATSNVNVVIGDTWDDTTLQEVLDAEYGSGAIDVMTDYEGYLSGDADPVYWEDLGVNSILVREIAGFANSNSLGWYEESLGGPPIIDGIGDGLIFPGPVADGAELYVEFPAGTTAFGFYLNSRGSDGTCNAPEPELFFTNRFYNDIGVDGSGATHAPFDGDVQCLVFNISHLRGGVPTFVLAWEDFDSGAELSPNYSACLTDNDFNDMVLEISAFSPVKVESDSWGSIKARFGE